MFTAGVLPFLTGLVQTFLFPDSVSDSPVLIQDSRGLEFLFVFALCLIVAWTSVMAGRPLPVRRIWSAGFLVVLGSLLIFSSMFLTITVPTNYEPGRHGQGWQVLDRQEQWITAQASVGQSAFMGGAIKWLQPIFPTFAYPIYTLTIVATLAVLIVVASYRFSLTRLADSKTFDRLTASLSLASVWILTDIHWGWHFDFAEYPFPAALGALTWFAMLVFASIAAWRIVHGDHSPELISWLRLIQLPLIAFNLMLMRAYFEPGSFVPLQGLATLLVGLPSLSWACQQILLTSRREQELDIALKSPRAEELSPELIVAGR